MGLSNYVPNSRISQAGVVDNTADRPASPYEGQVLYQRDTNQLLVWDGSAWIVPNSTTANPAGLELVKTQTVGTAVPSVTVSNAFSADYDAYQIIYTGGTSSSVRPLSLQIGNATTGYYSVTIYGGYTTGGPSIVRDTNSANFTYIGHQSTTNSFISCRVFSPFATKTTSVFADYAEFGTNSNGGMTTGYLDNSNSYTDFTIARAGIGTMTGGTIRVYGYRN